ncbi:MAG: aldehyde dehydrogenase family protein [Leptospiraceae bacterium]|nr:aldehyde dehydrogenase family protein [Leptospiraceae bacterium]MDW8307593.1 aldehyde dehydrogenase family protein [Leptospiraceae bacterium]
MAKKLKELFERQREFQKKLRLSSAQDRIAKLEKLRLALENTAEELYQAMYDDYRKPRTETDIIEIAATVGEINHLIRILPSLMKPQVVGTPLMLLGSQSEIRYEPKGTSLIISPWNYPVHLSLTPLAGAIAAGCTAILKPSEYVPHTSAYLSRLIASTFREEEVAVVEGEAEVAKELLELPFDHIFFTGSTEIGKYVMAAAAKHLSSVTLELGGKSPVIIDESASLPQAVRKIMWGKFVNCGQTCVAPDYVLLPRSLEGEFIRLAREVLEEFYGKEEERIKSPDYARIVNKRHFDRLKSYLDEAMAKGAKVVVGGITDENELYFAPTILSQVNLDSRVMKEEIFGPILPLVPVNSLQGAIDFVNARPKPLALYIFSDSQEATEKVLRETSSGGVAVDDVVLHLANPFLPFGGVGPSGMGNYHGKYSFLAFSHEKAVLRQNKLLAVAQIAYPPYTGLKNIVQGLVKKVM